jgi:pimeloyl-ACP methyl ester carboxylesterase
MIDEKRIVLVHGWAASAVKLEPLAEELRKLGWTVFIPKLPGFDLPPPAEAWGVNEYAAYALGETSRFFEGRNFFFFGHSFGGRLAIKLGATQPININGLVLCAAAGVSKVNPVKRYIFLTAAKLGKLILKLIPAAGRLRSLLYRLAREHDYEKTQGTMREVFGKVVSEDLEAAATQIQLPTLLLWGKQDNMTKLSDAYRIKRAVPHAQLVLYENEGHRLPYNKPHELATEIDIWVSSLSSN